MKTKKVMYMGEEFLVSRKFVVEHLSETRRAEKKGEKNEAR